MTHNEKVIDGLFKLIKHLEDKVEMLENHPLPLYVAKKQKDNDWTCTYIFPSTSNAMDFIHANDGYFNFIVLDKDKEYCLILKEYKGME